MATLLTLIAALALLGGCGGGKTVTRVGTDTTIDLSGRWNDADSRLVAEELIAQATTSPWVENHLLAHGKKPAVIVGNIANKSSEHIPVNPFMADVERAFINSGRVRMVATAEQREQLRDERADQQQYASQESMKQWGRELGADYIMLGEINTIIDREEGDEVKFYQVDVYLIDLQDNTKAWAGFKKIKKYVSRDGYRP
ncbi:penicillin-binding protein activator LpoB [bacterium]|nr:penicillin-binding protein activator LpoB [bacterium]MBU1072085.1 penicillin-binding protein activator LpoB [bacterium]